MVGTKREKNSLLIICSHISCRALFVRIAVVLLALGIASCSKQGNSQTPSGEAPGGGASASPGASSAAAEITPEVRDLASKIFADRCATCHGKEGRGDGPGAANLTPKPRDFHDPAWQSSVTDSQIESVIVYGGAAAGKSPLMVGNPDLASQPAVVSALRQMIRKMGSEK